MISPSEADTPLMRQYLEARARHPGALLFFRLGDFYELFFDDAEFASRALGITLTSRSRDREGRRIPMAGVPVRTVNTYLRRLVQTGVKVAVCDQVEDAADADGLVDRQVVQVVTPGTFIDDDRLDASRALHLAAIVRAGNGLGLAWVDLSTGKFHAEDLIDHRQAEGALLRIAPAECLHVEGEDLPALEWLKGAFPNCALTPMPEWNFERVTARERLLAHFGTRTLDGFGAESLGAALGAAGALLHYLAETQKQALAHITALVPRTGSRRMVLDAASHRALDLVEVSRSGERKGSLLAHIDRTATPMGARLLRDWLLAPLVDRDEILARQESVAAFATDANAALGEALDRVRDIERLASRVTLGRANPRDLKALEHSLAAAPAIVELLAPFEARLIARLRSEIDAPKLALVAAAIAAAIVDEPPVALADGGVVRAGYDAALDELRAAGRDGVDWLARFQEEESRRTGIPSLKVGYNRVFGYFIEVTNAHSTKIPAEYTRKQTLKNAERYTTPELKEQEHRVLGARERALALEAELVQALRARIQGELLRLQSGAAAIAELDALLSLARLARESGYTRPEIVEEPVLEIEAGRHPVLASSAMLGDRFVPNDMLLGGERGTLAVITGPNMAGKSTYIRQGATVTILAQIGGFVPAARARIGIADRIFTRVGASDELSRGQSTFMVEMTETAAILNNATPRSLVILDEVGRGTSTLDGVSLAWAIAESLIERNRARTLFATHYHELTELAERFPGRVTNLNVAVREWRDEIVFLHKILPGATDKSYGIHVARLAGIPPPVLERARDILAALETEHRQLRGAAKEDPRQLDLFESSLAEIAARLERIDPDHTTPMEALKLLVELRKMLP